MGSLTNRIRKSEHRGSRSIRRIREIGNREGNKKQKKKGKSQLFLMCEMMGRERERESGEVVVDSLLSLMAGRRVDKSLKKPENT